MVRSYLKTILAVFILVSVATAVSWAKTDTKAANEAAIKKLVASWDECFERKDAHACASLRSKHSSQLATSFLIAASLAAFVSVLAHETAVATETRIKTAKIVFK